MKVAVYVRVSSEEQVQEGYSIPAQISLLKNYAATYSYNVVKIYQDAGISGKDIDGRPALLELLNDAKNKKFEALLIWKLSRLSRSLLDLLFIVDELKKNDIALISYSERFDTSTPVGKMLLQLLGSIAEFERNTIIENVKMGMNERFNQGHSKGKIPFGYIYVDKKAVINKAQAEMVKFAFDYYNKSASPDCLQYIADYFTQNGFKTCSGGIWSRLTMRELLMNKFYAGYVRTGVKSHGRKAKNYSEKIGAHEPIIDIETFEKANDKLNSNRNNASIRNPDNENVLTGLITCPKCGAKMYALNTYSKYTRTSGENKEYMVKGYRCINSAKGKQFCPGFSIAASKIESKVLELIFGMTDSNVLNSAKKHSDSEMKKLAKPIVNNLKIIDKQLQELNNTKEKYFKIIESSTTFNANIFAEKFNELDIKISELEKLRDTELSKKPITDLNYDLKGFKAIIKQFNSLYDELSNEDKKLSIRAIVSEIFISEDRELIEVKLVNGLIIPYLKLG